MRRAFDGEGTDNDGAERRPSSGARGATRPRLGCASQIVRTLVVGALVGVILRAALVQRF